MMIAASILLIAVFCNVHGNLLLPRGLIESESVNGTVNGTETCNIEIFQTCASRYFERYGFTKNPASESAFQEAYENIEVNHALDGFKSACDWIITFEDCTVPSACWTPENIAMLGFNQTDATGLFYMFWNSAYLCSTGYDTVVSHMDCMWSKEYHSNHHDNLYKCVKTAIDVHDPKAKLCSMIVAEVDCVYDVYKGACNEHEPKMHCPGEAKPMKHDMECPANLEHICYAIAKSSGILSSAFALILATLFAHIYRLT